MTLVKARNHMRLYQSYRRSQRLGTAEILGMPSTISIEPTTACNLRCPECPSGLRSFTRPTGNLKQDFFRGFISELESNLMYLIFYFQGEPYINPQFLDMVDYASKKGIYTITSTNGHFLNEDIAERTVRSGLSRILISIDGATQETYSAYRREGQLEQVIEGTKNIVAAKKRLKSKTPHIVFQFLVVRPNEHEIPAIKKLAKELGVDELKLKTAQIYDYKNGSDLIPQNHRYSRYRPMSNGTYAIKNELQNRCWKMWQSCVITWDGRVVPCCFDKDASHAMGELQSSSFKEIWHGQPYRSFRNAILKGRDKIDICTNCTEGMNAWA
jgi:radical SAM protein with 4Fe4S-binding SPASM domain